MSSDDGPTNGVGFLAYVEQQLVPLKPGATLSSQVTKRSSVNSARNDLN